MANKNSCIFLKGVTGVSGNVRADLLNSSRVEAVGHGCGKGLRGCKNSERRANGGDTKQPKRGEKKTGWSSVR